MSNQRKGVLLRLDSMLLLRIDAARGAMKRTAWLTDVITSHLDGLDEAERLTQEISAAAEAMGYPGNSTIVHLESSDPPKGVQLGDFDETGVSRKVFVEGSFRGDNEYTETREVPAGAGLFMPTTPEAAAEFIEANRDQLDAAPDAEDEAFELAEQLQSFPQGERSGLPEGEVPEGEREGPDSAANSSTSPAVVAGDTPSEQGLLSPVAAADGVSEGLGNDTPTTYDHQGISGGVGWPE